MSQILWRASRQFTDTKGALHWWRNAYRAELPPRGFVWIIHGLGDHAARYGEFAQFLCQLGYDVLAPDLPGHGLSRVEGGQNKLVTVPEMLEEIRAAQRWWLESGPIAKRGLAHTPWYLFGHSMGSLLSLALIVEGQPKDAAGDFAQRAFVSAPPLALRLPVPSWKVHLAKKLAGLTPHLEIDSGIRVDHLSTDAVVVALARRDPLMHTRASPALFLSMEEWKAKILGQPQNIEIPLALGVGDADPIVDPGAIQNYYEQLGTHKKLFVVKDARHETLNEVDRKDTFAKVAGWFS